MTTKEKIILVLRIFLGVLFLISAYSKFISTGLIEIILIDHGVTASRETAAIITRILVGMEFGLGVLFLQPFYLKRGAAILSALFLIGFTGYLVYTGFILGDKQNCGCFGEMISMTPTESIIKNIFLLILNIWLFILIKEERKNFIVPLLLILLSLAAVFLLSPLKSVNEFQFGNYRNFEGRGRVDLSSGDKLVAVFNTECEHCQQTAAELAEMQKRLRWFPEMYVLIFVEGSKSVKDFNTLTNSDFPYKTISATEFFNLIGSSPPRIYWLQNGVIKEKWDSDFVKNIALKFGKAK